MPGVSINLRILEEADLITEKRKGKKDILFEQKDNFRVSGFLMICITIN